MHDFMTKTMSIDGLPPDHVLVQTLDKTIHIFRRSSLERAQIRSEATRRGPFININGEYVGEISKEEASRFTEDLTGAIVKW